MKTETRNFELRTASDTGKPRRLAGYACVFNRDSEDMGFIEQIAPGAFAEALKTSDCRALLNHDSGVVLGRESAGTLRLSEDGHGLKFELDLPGTQAGRDTWESVRRGDIRECSFAFSVAPGGDRWTDGGRRRTITKVGELFDVSPVTYPAYSDTSVEARRRPGKIISSDDYENPAKAGVPMDDRSGLSDSLTSPMTPVGRSHKKPEKNRSSKNMGTITDIDEEIARLQAEKRDLIAMRPDPNSGLHRSIEVVRDEADQSFGSLGEMLVAVRSAGTPGGFRDPRLESRASGLNEGLGSDGGFLVQTEHATGLLKNTWEKSPILPLLDKTPLSGNKNGLTRPGLDETSRANGSRAGGILSYWKSEAQSATASKPKFRQIDLKLHKLIGLCYATDELADDATALESVISKGFEDEFDFRITDAVINGTGAGQPLGIMGAGSLVTVAKESEQDADTVKYENVCKMVARLMPSSFKRSVWCVSQTVLPQLFTMAVSVGTAGGAVPVYLPPGGASASPYGTLFGRPVHVLEQCQTLGDKGDIMLCDFSKYLAIDKGAMQKASSIHVRFVEDEMAFRFVYRFDGQPMLASPITPKNGTDTLSHFVALAERS